MAVGVTVPQCRTVALLHWRDDVPVALMPLDCNGSSYDGVI